MIKSNRELAHKLEVNEAAVEKAEQTGRIQRQPDGTWDLGTVLVHWIASEQSDEQCEKMERKLDALLEEQDQRSTWRSDLDKAFKAGLRP